jgi:PAS domain S-box-containing protein
MRRHRLLARQLRRAFGVSSERELQQRLDELRTRGDPELAAGLEAMLAATQQTYIELERDLQVRTRMLEISSEELTRANAQLHESARDKLAAAEAAHRRILNSLREVVFQTDTLGDWAYLNPAWEHITGFTVEDTLGRRAMRYVQRDDGVFHYERILALISGEQNHFRGQMRFKHRAGGCRWLEVYARRIEDEHGRAVGLSGSLIDITEQKLAQDQLIISEQRLHQALRATDSHLWDWDMGRAQPYVDPLWLASLGYLLTEDERARVDWGAQLHPEDRPRWVAHLREHLRRERLELDIEMRFRMINGDYRHTLVRGKAVAWSGRRALRLAGTLQDISPRKEAEAAAQRQQELTEQILDQLPIAVFLKDRSGRFVRFNRTFQRYSTFTREQMMGHRIEDFASERWSAATHEEDAQAWSSGRMVTSERRLNRLDPPVDMLINRIVITSGGESYLLGFSIDVSEQRAAREAMQRAVEAAEASSRAKSEFLANMSHEIRTPMNGILGMTELLLQSELSAEQREDLTVVKASADGLLTIINDILDFSKIEAGRLEIEEVPFDLGRLVQETARSMGLGAQQKGLELVCQLPPDLPRTVKGDPGRLRQVLLNLIGNAIKFTEQGQIEVSVHAGAMRQDSCELTFSVRDTGIGVPPDKQKLIFEAFLQGDGSTTRQYGGTGLGLTICRRLVILMNGRMDLASSPGGGSTFSFTVPLRQTGVSLNTALPALWREELPVPLTLAAPVPSDQGTGLRILLAEDNLVNQRLAVRLLEKLGHRVTLVDNGLAAHERARRGGFDLILLDVQMPGLDGLSVTRRIRQHEAQTGEHVPIVAMTARAMAGDRERCLEAGMDDYLAKPIDSARLRQVLAQFEPPDSTPLPDWRDALQRLDGDTTLFLELAAIFLDDGPALLQGLWMALEGGDVPASRRAVHSLKGVLANFGARQAMECADLLAASLHDPAQAGQWLALGRELGPRVDQVNDALRQFIAAGPAALA